MFSDNITRFCRGYDGSPAGRSLPLHFVKMIPVKVTESVSVMTLPGFAERSVESSVRFADSRRHKSVVSFEPTLAPVKFADTLIVFGPDSTRKRYVSRTFYEPRVKPRKFAETDFVFPKEKTERFASFLDYHIDECRKWFKTCMELKARTFTTVTTVPSAYSRTSDVTRRDVSGGDADDVGSAGPGASQVFIPPQKVGGQRLEEKNFRVKVKKNEVDVNMNRPISNWF